MKVNFIYAGLLTFAMSTTIYGMGPKQIKQGLFEQAHHDKNIKIIFYVQGTPQKINKKLDKKRKQLVKDAIQAHEQGNVVKILEYDGNKFVERRGFNLKSLMVIPNQYQNRGLLIYIVPQY